MKYGAMFGAYTIDSLRGADTGDRSSAVKETFFGFLGARGGGGEGYFALVGGGGGCVWW